MDGFAILVLTVPVAAADPANAGPRATDWFAVMMVIALEMALIFTARGHQRLRGEGHRANRLAEHDLPGHSGRLVCMLAAADLRVLNPSKSHCCCLITMFG